MPFFVISFSKFLPLALTLTFSFSLSLSLSLSLSVSLFTLDSSALATGYCILVTSKSIGSKKREKQVHDLQDSGRVKLVTLVESVCVSLSLSLSLSVCVCEGESKVAAVEYVTQNTIQHSCQVGNPFHCKDSIVLMVQEKQQQLQGSPVYNNNGSQTATVRVTGTKGTRIDSIIVLFFISLPLCLPLYETLFLIQKERERERERERVTFQDHPSQGWSVKCI